VKRATYRTKTLIVYLFLLVSIYLNKEEVEEARGFAFV